MRGTHRPRIVVVSEEKVLVVRPWLGLGKWDVPGGGAHKGEDFQSAASREVAEETSIKIKAQELEPYDIDKVNHGWIRFTAHYYLAKVPVAEQPKPSFPEISRAAWLDEDQLRACKMDEAIRRLVLDCLLEKVA